ncbi:Ubiquitin ligase protein cop1 protein [Thalictrum thalictroides]|uniref:Ubiquitin ligase protein cop1 protein n=1 Tax=Thalictrum thalictroides TaxID=46969 RepID=A0A7J6X7D1_THATH|nr:Ubiquitin ligase protein cop1 protein [Thalictrum thalictroides]
MNFHPPIHQTQEERKEEEEQEEKARCEWNFNLGTIVTSSNCVGSAISDTIGTIEFDPTDHFLATGGIARKIRIYSLKSLLPDDSSQATTNTTTLLEHTSACDYYICTPAKLSSLRWKPNANGRVIGSGDYDGVVTEYDLERCMPIFERDEHGGRCIWSLDYSHSSPTVGASGSDDGTMQMWDARCDANESAMAMVQPSMSHSPICSVEFDQYGGELIAMGCADRKAYVYDIRNMSNPISVYHGHRKTVSYVRFLGEGMMVSAGTDGCLKLWNMSNGTQTIRTYKGHINNRNFVGLSVWRNGGLFGCGSESNEVFVYDKRWGNPMWVHGLDPMSATRCDDRFISSVCWRQITNDECTLVAGGSDGVLQVFLGKRKSSTSGDHFSHSPTF